MCMVLCACAVEEVDLTHAHQVITVRSRKLNIHGQWRVCIDWPLGSCAADAGEPSITRQIAVRGRCRLP